jgi:hypothetical protein
LRSWNGDSPRQESKRALELYELKGSLAATTDTLGRPHGLTETRTRGGSAPTVEERYMTDQLPDTYTLYKRSTRMLVPFVF